MKALVTGGGGFLGSTIVRKLIERDDEVSTLQRGDYPHLREMGVTCHRVELGRAPDGELVPIVEGSDVVIHTAAKAGVWGSHDEYWWPNVKGTTSLLHACSVTGVKHFVYTSSPSVAFHGKDESGVDESIPYPDRYLTHYPATKAEAEKHVLAQPQEKLATVALRPHLIWGPRDPHLVPRVIERAKAGKLKLVGSGQNLVDSTYVDNAADAHILAADKLLAKGSNAACAGKAYFISNDEPVAMAELLNRILAAGGLPPVTRSVSPGVAYAAGAILESVYKLLRKKKEPIMTRFVAKQLSTAHWFDLTGAKRDLGYNPAVSIDQGMAQLSQWLQTTN